MSDDSDIQGCLMIALKIHNKRNQVSYHIYILQMQQSPARARTKQPAEMVAQHTCTVETNTPGPNNGAQH